MSLQFQYALSTIISSVAALCLGVFVLLKNPKARANQLWCAFNVTIAGWAIPQSFYVTIQDAALADLLVRLSYAVGVLWIPTFFLHFVLVYLNRVQRFLLYFAYGFSLFHLALVPYHWFLAPAQHKFSLSFYTEPGGPWWYIFFSCWSALVFYSIRKIYLAMRRSQGARKNQLRYLFSAMCIGYIGGMSNFLPVFDLEWFPYNPYGTYGIPIYIAIFTYAIVRHQLLDIRVVIKRSLIYSLLVTSLTIGYFGLVYAVEWVFRTTFGYHSVWLSLAAFALMALVFQPLKVGIQRIVDRLFFRAPHEGLARRMERLEQEVRQVDKLKAVSTLAAGMAHEIKNPLTSLKTFATYLPEKGNDPAFQQKFQQVVTQEVDKIDHIVRRLLEFAKPAPPQFEPTAVSQLLNETLDVLSSEALRRRIEITRTCDDTDTIQADPQQLRQVFLNLFLNSLEAMNGSGGTLSVATIRNGSNITVTIRDTGKGIPKEYLNHIFDPFFTTKSNGTGLGLSIVQSIVAEHRGTITFESQPTRGTTCTLTFPLR